MSIRVAYGRDSRIPFPPGQSQLVVDQTPIRTIDTIGDLTGTTYRLGLDDARPWRAAVSQATSVQPAQIVVTVGGAPESISDRIAVDLPAPSTVVTRDLRVIGQARVFEANVSWRVRESSNRVVASGHFNASLGTSAVWGTFDTTIAIPASVSGNVTLELYEASAKDGSEVGLVRVALTVR